MMTRRGAVAALLLASLIWGVTFPLIKLVLPFVSPLVFNAARFLLATLIVFPALRGLSRQELRAGAQLGLLLVGGFTVQTIGLTLTTPSRSGFITGLYVPLVPVVAFLLHQHRPRPTAVLSVAIAVGGMYLLTKPAEVGGGLNLGDWLTLGAALLFAVHLVLVANFARAYSLTRLLSVQIVTAAVVSIALLPLDSAPHLAWTPLVVGVILFEAVFATAIALRLQLAAQQALTPTHAAVIFASEPVVAAVASLLLLGERLSPLQWVGGCAILVGMVLPEVGEGDATVTEP